MRGKAGGDGWLVGEEVIVEKEEGGNRVEGVLVGGLVEENREGGREERSEI